jgi:hypothetical protein
MLNPVLTAKAFATVAAASANQTLPEPAAILLHCALSSGSGTAVATFVDQAIVTGAPSAGQVQFTGTGTSPSNALTFNAALTANDELVGTYIPPYSFPRAA